MNISRLSGSIGSMINHKQKQIKLSRLGIYQGIFTALATCILPSALPAHYVWIH